MPSIFTSPPFSYFSKADLIFALSLSLSLQRTQGCPCAKRNLLALSLLVVSVRPENSPFVRTPLCNGRRGPGGFSFAREIPAKPNRTRSHTHTAENSPFARTPLCIAEGGQGDVRSSKTTLTLTLHSVLRMSVRALNIFTLSTPASPSSPHSRLPLLPLAYRSRLPAPSC